MSHRLTAAVATALCVFAGAVALVAWFSCSSGRAVAVRRQTALEAGTATSTVAEAEVVDIRGSFEKFDGATSSIPGAWPRFRGAAFDNIVRDSPPLADRWPEGGPKALWSVDLGEGYAGPAVWEGRVYLLDYDEKRQGDALRCFSLDDGREIWRRWYKVHVKRNHGMSRTVPAVADGVVVTIGPRCHVMCVDARSGDFKWGLDLVREFGTQVPMWYTGQCPLVENGVAVMAPGGSALLIGVDVQTGRVVWKTPNPHAWNMSHASVMPMEFAGRRAYVYAAIGGVAGVAADGNERGAVLWESAEWNHAVVSPSPVPLADGRILLTAGYGVGSRMMQVQQTNSGFAVRSLFPLDRQVFACEQHTPLFYQGHLFTVLPSDAGARKQQLVCMTPEGRVTWASGEAYRYGLGPFMIADGKLFMLDDNGKLSLLRASAERFERLAEAKVLSGVEAWAPLALVQGRLLARDRNRMVCLDVAAR